MIRRLAHAFFRWYCDPYFYPDIQGDLEEMYQDNRDAYGKWRAEWKYFWDVLLLFRPSLIRNFGQNSIFLSMFSNYFKISFRHLLKHKSYSLINVLGLALGLASFMLIMMYVNFERSYDRFHSDSDRLYRVSQVLSVDGVVEGKDAMASYPLGKLMSDKLPEVEHYTLSQKMDEFTLKVDEQVFKESQVISADSNFLKLFDYKVLQGNSDHLFNEPRSVVLTEHIASKYFGDSNPIGKTLKVITPVEADLMVTGVIEDAPRNTHYRFDILVSDPTLADQGDYNEWNYNNYYLYVKLRETANLEDVRQQLVVLADEHYGEENTRFWDIHKVTDIHLHSDFTYEPQIHGDIRTVHFLSVIGIILIIIAWVNYINLSTAKAVERAREVGLRKVVGAERRQLITQFVVEAVLINMIGGLIALVLMEGVIPLFNQMIGFQLLAHSWNNSTLIIGTLGLAAVGAFLSGFYPAIVMSRYQPVKVLKGKYMTSRSGVILRRTLVTVQFIASFVLIASTLIVNKQVNYMRDRDMGMTVDKVITFALPSANISTEEEEKMQENQRKAFRNALLDLPNVVVVGASDYPPGGGSSDISSTTSKISIPGFREEIKGTTYMQWNDYRFFDALQVDFLVGESFRSDMASDSNAVVVNRTFLEKNGLTLSDTTIGSSFKLWGNTHRIKGVIEDFNRTTLKSEVEPTIYLPWDTAPNLVVLLSDQNTLQAIEEINDVWSQFFPIIPFDFTFLDQRFEQLYYQDRIFGKVFFTFSLIAIAVSMLGLFGLSSFTALQRTKEMGIRKVLGASFNEIAISFYKDFLWLLLVASLIGLPLLYFLMDPWLNNYAFRIDFPWFVPVIALLIIVISALVSVGYQTIRMTRVNPVETLKYE